MYFLSFILNIILIKLFIYINKSLIFGENMNKANFNMFI